MSTLEARVVQFGHWLHRWRWLVVLVSLAFTVASLTGTKTLFESFRSDYRVFFSSDNPQMLAFEELQNTYDKADNVLFVLAPKSGKVFTPKILADIQWLTEQAWQVPYSSRVDSITNFQYSHAEDDDLIVEDLVAGDPANLSAAELEAVGDIALAEPNLRNRLINPERSVTGVNVTVQLPEDSLLAVPEVVAFVRDLAAQTEARNPDLEVRMTGVVMMNNAFPEASFGDLQFLYPLMLLVVMILLWLMLRSVSGVVITLLILIMSTLTGLGIAGWSGIAMSGPLSSAPTIILTMAVADSVHLLVTFLQNLRRGMTKADAMVESLRINMNPVFMTSLTTVIGFLTMNFSEVPPLNDLGNTVAMGVVMAFLFSITFLPALVMILPFKTKTRASRGTALMDRLSHFVIARRKPLLYGMTLVSIALIAFVPRNELNDEFVKYFSPNIDFRAHTDFTTDNLTGLYTIFYGIESGESQGVSDPDFLEKMEAFAEYAEQQPEVMHVQTITDTLKRLNRNMHADDATWQKLPGDRELAAQYLLLYELSLPYGLDLNNQLNIDKSATRIQLSLYSLSSQAMIDLEDRFSAWFAENAPDLEYKAASPGLMFAHIGQRNITSMLEGSLLALVLISLALMFMLRSFRLGMISLIPNLIPIGVGFGIWGLFVANVGMGLSVVTGMVLGIVVDDTVHFLSKYLRARREKGLTSPEAVRYAFSTVGVALSVTTLVLVAGFLVLGLSDYVMNADMGVLTAITIAAALIIDFLLLPPLLMKMEELEHAKSPATAELSDTAA